MQQMRRSEKRIDSTEEIDEILRRGTVCYLALKDEPFPYVIPLSYGYGSLPVGSEPDGEESTGETSRTPARALFFHGAGEGRKVDLARRDPRAAFVVDIDHELVTDEQACRFTMHYRSVMGTGRIRFLEASAQKRYALDRIMHQYTGRQNWDYSDKAMAGVSIFALVIEELSGKRSLGTAPK
jgi:nitroimidazol reductase NimA-like FMN-containing flavoprotein (pyridoxamine 5'-phosphate oxidase superfamily)